MTEAAPPGRGTASPRRIRESHPERRSLSALRDGRAAHARSKREMSIMPETIQTRSCYIFLVLLLVSISSSMAQGQGPTTSFTYQGRLTDSGTAANGNYDLQFALFDSVAGGAQIGSTLTRTSVAARVGSFMTLSPRQQISSTPFAIRTLSAAKADTATTATTATNATQLGGVAAN